MEYTWNHHWKGQRSALTLYRCGKQVTEILGDDVPVNRIETQHLDDLRTGLASMGQSDGTINRKLTAISKMLTLAFKRG